MKAVKKVRTHEEANANDPDDILTNRELNRALLARQMLLSRVRLPVADVIENLVGMQAQAPNAPYLGLWSRIEAFRHEELSQLLRERQVVRMALMRSTLHLVSAQDALLLRPLLQPVMDRSLKGAFGKQLQAIDQEALAAAGRAWVEKEPMTSSELGLRLSEQWPGLSPEAAAAVVRNRIPLVQLPPRGIWGESGQAVHTSVEVWLGRALSAPLEPEWIIRRYLAAFGPATVKDMQVWSGLTRIHEHLAWLRQHLITFRNEKGEVLFDLPDAPRPAADTPSSPRFLGEFDNMLLSYVDRNRIMDEAYRKRVFTANGIIRATILIDGFVAGTWKISTERERSVLYMEPFRALTGQEQEALSVEAAHLLQFVSPAAAARDIVYL
ncbi:winged helix DNA-binding domain-containing protein [Paenibacillus sp. strain BS8-2]